VAKAVSNLNLTIILAKKFPGLVFPDKAAIRPGELIGFLSNILQQLPTCREEAEKHLPKKEEH